MIDQASGTFSFLRTSVGWFGMERTVSWTSILALVVYLYFEENNSMHEVEMILSRFIRPFLVSVYLLSAVLVIISWVDQ